MACVWDIFWRKLLSQTNKRGPLWTCSRFLRHFGVYVSANICHTGCSCWTSSHRCTLIRIGIVFIIIVFVDTYVLRVWTYTYRFYASDYLDTVRRENSYCFYLPATGPHCDQSVTISRATMTQKYGNTRKQIWKCSPKRTKDLECIKQLTAN